MPDPIKSSGGPIDLSDRIIENHTVAASPAAGAITTVATLTWSPPDNPTVVKGAFLDAVIAFTAGTNGVSALLEIRRGSSVGTVIASSGAVTVTAGNLYSLSAQGIDAVAFAPGQAWVVCLTIGSGSAPSTVSAVSIFGLIV